MTTETLPTMTDETPQEYARRHHRELMAKFARVHVTLPSDARTYLTHVVVEGKELPVVSVAVSAGMNDKVGPFVTFVVPMEFVEIEQAKS